MQPKYGCVKGAQCFGTSVYTGGDATVTWQNLGTVRIYACCKAGTNSVAACSAMVGLVGTGATHKAQLALSVAVPLFVALAALMH